MGDGGGGGEGGGGDAGTGDGGDVGRGDGDGGTRGGDGGLTGDPPTHPVAENAPSAPMTRHGEPGCNPSGSVLVSCTCWYMTFPLTVRHIRSNAVRSTPVVSDSASGTEITLSACATTLAKCGPWSVSREGVSACT